jgi:hypothetical protein
VLCLWIAPQGQIVLNSDYRNSNPTDEISIPRECPEELVDEGFEGRSA